MKHLLILAMLLIGNSLVGAQSSSPIKLSVVRQNKGKIVRSVTLDISSISAYIENNRVMIDFSFIPNDILITIHDRAGILVHQETVNSQNTHISIDISKWDKNDYTINFIELKEICIIGCFSII